MTTYTLPKWPALVVHGLPVTREQAAVILVRTDSAIDDSLYATNDQVWNRTIANAAGWPDIDRRDSGSCDAAQERARERFGLLPLEYLHNAFPTIADRLERLEALRKATRCHKVTDNYFLSCRAWGSDRNNWCQACRALAALEDR